MCAKPTEGWGNLQEGGQSYHPLRRSLGSSLHLPMMQKWVEYVRRASGDSCIWNTGRQYGDWLALDAGEGNYTGASRKEFIATAFYAHSAQLLAQAMDALDMDGAAQFEVSTPVDAEIRLHGISRRVAPGMYQFAAEQFVSGAFTDI